MFSREEKNFRDGPHAEQNAENNMTELRDWLRDYYRELDLRQNNPHYSYEKEFNKLEEYLALLPRCTKYTDMTSFFGL